MKLPLQGNSLAFRSVKDALFEVIIKGIEEFFHVQERDILKNI